MQCSTLNEVDVIVSSSHNVFDNLALELCLHKFLPVSKKALFLYRNTPSIVIGKFQNPWLELNCPAEAAGSGITVARRCSGGGTVYHDLGNLNISFLMPRSSFSKRANLEFVVSFLQNSMNCDVEVNERDDLTYRGLKISGSACRIERLRTIHHLTLLMQSKLEVIGKFLGHKNGGYEVLTKATESVRSRVGNLFDHQAEWSKPDYNNFCFSLGQSFCEHHDLHNQTIQVVDPNDFSEVISERDKLQEFHWLFGLTPKFSLTANFDECSLELTFTVEKGYIKDVQLKSRIESVHQVNETGDVLRSHLIGCKFLTSEICYNLDLISNKHSILRIIANEIRKLLLF